MKSYFKSEFKKYKYSCNTLHLTEIFVFSKKEINCKIRFENKDEFHYSNQMYDIISQKVTKDSIEYKVFNDKNEKILYSSFFSYLEKNTSDKTDSIKKILSNVFIGLVYFVTHLVLSIVSYFNCTNIGYNLILIYNSIYLEFPSPPPRF